MNQAADLEVEARANLHDARIVGRSDLTESCAVDVEHAAALADEEVGAIQDIERLKAQLKVSGFTHLEIPEESHVPVDVLRTVDKVNRQVAR